MANVDFTLDDLRAVFATKDDLKGLATKNDLDRFATKEDLKNLATKEDLTEVGRDVKRITVMLEEDAKAESLRLDRVDRRSAKTHKMLIDHISDKSIHRNHG